MAPVTRHPSLVTAFVALGGNIGDPPAQIRSALRALAKLRETRLVRRSSLYRNPPVGHLDQPEFVNAVAQIETRIGPRELLGHLLEIERKHGRERGYPNAPRTLDLDILLYGGQVVHEPGLVIPHPRMPERAFVLVPLAEIAPDIEVPGRGRVAGLLRNVDASGMIRLTETE
ncbi:MAG TPA: 2-amino-4-hydroxy-6-hydroxymethyldihydropteridine diphosphokinase [Burkholderiales bacterium]|nr:2-amino-4-hydroxy-6-hydroxymethyldihydropteridine diphosphokinase [Burkholderiales bacterium]